MFILKDMEIPKGWPDVSIDTYLKCFTIEKMRKEDEPPHETKIKTIAVLTGHDIKVIEDMKMTDFYELDEKLSWRNTLPKERLPLEFKFDNREWKAIVFQHEMTAGQFVDYSSILDKANKAKEDTVYHMHEFLATFIVPKGEKYAGYTKHSELFYDKMTMDIAYPFFVFFSNVLTRLSPHIQRYFLKQTKKNLKELRKQAA